MEEKRLLNDNLARKVCEKDFLTKWGRKIFLANARDRNSYGQNTLNFKNFPMGHEKNKTDRFKYLKHR